MNDIGPNGELISEDNETIINQPLIDGPTSDRNRILPNLNEPREPIAQAQVTIPEIRHTCQENIKECYKFSRFALAGMLIFYPIILIIVNIKTQDYNSVLPRTPRAIGEFNEHTIDILSKVHLRIIYSCVFILLVDIPECSILFNLCHRKKMLQLHSTLLLLIFFAFNNTTDDFQDKLTEEQQENSYSRYMVDIYFGMSPIRSTDPIIIQCYGIFDFVFYPNIVYFTLLFMIIFFGQMVLFVIEILNSVGITHIEIDIEDYLVGRREGRRVTGLSELELEKLDCVSYKSTKILDQAVLEDSKDQPKADVEDPKPEIKENCGTPDELNDSDVSFFDQKNRLCAQFAIRISMGNLRLFICQLANMFIMETVSKFG